MTLIDKLKPTQADRDAAADYSFKHENPVWWLPEAIRNGQQDEAPLVQAFARHRIAATDTQVSKLSEPVCANCEGLLGDLAAGRDPEELCDTCYEDSQAARRAALDGINKDRK